MHDIEELKRQGLSILAISEIIGYDRKTIRKYLIEPEVVPASVGRPAGSSKLDAFKPYVTERLEAGVWNARVLIRELREHGYEGGYTGRGAAIHRADQGALLAGGALLPDGVRRRGEDISLQSR